MKSLLFAPFVLLACHCTADAQQPVPSRKPPVGIPSDAKFFNGKWYRVYLEKTSWHSARDKCKALSGQLVIVPDAATWEFVKSLANGPNLWLGATDEVTQGVWKWVDGTPVEFNGAWEINQPDNLGGKQHYVAINRNKRWDDMEKVERAGPNQIGGYICEWKDK